MALSRSMKNLMHTAAQARRGGGNPTTGGGLSSMISQAAQQARSRGPRPTPGGVKITPRAGPKPPRGRAQIAVPGGRMPRGGVMGGPAGRRGPGTVAGKPMSGTGGVVRPTVKPRPAAGTFGFAGQGGGGGTPALQQATAGAKRQVLAQGTRAPMTGRPPQAANMQGRRPSGPAAIAQQRGQDVRQRLGARQGPPARRGGMARALGSGGSRRRMLR